MTNKYSKFCELVDRDSIYDSLFDHSSPGTMYLLGRTCRLAHLAVKDYTRRVFNINRHFEKFFTDPFEFRVVLARTHAIVSGSSALQFMGRMTYPNSDFDIFVANRHAAEVVDFITRQGGKDYRFVPTDRQIEKGITTPEIALRLHRERAALEVDINEMNEIAFYDNNNFRAVLNFKARNIEGPIVQVIVTHNTPMECLLGFHSTVVMNFITHAAAYSLFPNGTFEEGLMLPCDTRESREHRERGLEKYSQRGWKFAKPSTVGDPHTYTRKVTFILGKRCVGDEKTWTIRFDDVTEVVKFAKGLVARTDPITRNSFSLMRSPRFSEVKMQYSILNFPFFIDRYTACRESVPKIRFWCREIRDMEDAVEDCLKTKKRVAWDIILTEINNSLMKECTCCLPFDEQSEFRVCPAFLSSFAYFSVLAKQRIA